MLPRYVVLEIFQAMLESVAAENAARMTAMDSATNNANDVIDSLTLTHEPRAPGGHHERNYRDRQRRSSVVRSSGRVAGGAVGQLRLKQLLAV